MKPIIKTLNVTYKAYQLQDFSVLKSQPNRSVVVSAFMYAQQGW